MASDDENRTSGIFTARGTDLQVTGAECELLWLEEGQVDDSGRRVTDTVPVALYSCW